MGKILYKLIFYVLLLALVVSTSLLYAEQYSPECRQTIVVHSFEFLQVFVINPFLLFVEHFNWAFLVLMLFLIPSCREIVYFLIEKLGRHIVDYGKATHPMPEVNVTAQTAQEKKEFKKEQKDEIKEQAKEAKEEPSSFRNRVKNYERLQEFAKEKLNQLNIENYIENSKLLIIDDPVMSSGTLLFDYSYRYKGEKSARCYINTLLLRNPPIYRDSSKLYRYIRVMDDINKSKRNQRYSIEIILLNTQTENSDVSVFAHLAEKYKPAIDSGVLILREYTVKNDKETVTGSLGWLEY